MTDLQQASKILQGAPFHLPASEWELRQLSNGQLQQVLMDISGRVCSLYKISMLKLGDDALELLVLFLKAIKYPSPDHRLMLETEPKETMLGVLGWMASTEASRPGLLEKRAFVGYHLTLPQVPPAVFEQDEEAAGLLADVRDQQQRFVGLHRAREELRRGLQPPTALKLHVQRLQQDHGQLQRRVTQAQANLASVPNADAVKAGCKMLRNAEGQAAQLLSNWRLQSRNLAAAQAVSREATARADALQAVSDSGNLPGLLDQEAVQQHLPQEQSLRIRRLEALHAMLALDTVSEADVRWQQQAAAQMEAEIQAIMLRRQSEEKAVGSSQAGQLRQAAQFMASAVGKRRSEAEQMLHQQQQRLAALQQDSVPVQRHSEQLPPAQGSTRHSNQLEAAAELKALDLIITSLHPLGSAARVRSEKISSAADSPYRPQERLQSTLANIVTLQAELQAAELQQGAAQLDQEGDAEAAVQMLEARDKTLSLELKGVQDRISLLKEPAQLAELRKSLEEQIMELSATAAALRSERNRVQTARQEQPLRGRSEAKLQPTPPPAGLTSSTKRPGTVRVFSTPTGKVMQL
ncbi:hypothetical protein WJX74_010577 [Apatococcus lobatus]|uniref:IFT81 calponin homology domain-containing protein n=1 Tax=Apatococcus lobatus TaxID=904363 RepID=A0AAW1S4Z3_9CHLO